MNTTTEFINPVYVNTRLQTANEALAIELLNGATTQALTGFMPRVFKSAAAGLVGFLTSKFDYYKARSLAHDQDGILLKLKDVGFEKIAELPVTSLEGFSGQYVAYGQQMLANLDFFKTYTAPDLARYKLLLGDVLTNRTARLDLVDLTKRYRLTEKARTENDADNAEFFTRGSHIAIQPLGKVVERVADLTTVFADGQAIIERIKALDPDAVKAQVTEINDLVTLMVEDIDTGAITELSKAQIQNLSQGIMELAYQIEHFSLAYYRAVTYVTAVERLTEVLSKV